MTTNLVESINSVLNKTRNLPICALVKSTYQKYNNLFNQKGKEVATMKAMMDAMTENLTKSTIKQLQLLILPKQPILSKTKVSAEL